MRSEIKALHQRLQTTSVYVTHDQIEAMTMADRIVVMHDGRVEQVGAPLDLYDRPGNLFVADFLGSPSMNFINGTVRRAGGAAEVVTESGTALPVYDAATAEEGQPVVLGLRPEHLDMAGADEGIPATVQVVEPTGANTEVYFHMAGHDICAVFTERHRLNAGAQVSLSWSPRHVHLFDRATGQRL